MSQQRVFNLFSISYYRDEMTFFSAQKEIKHIFPIYNLRYYVKVDKAENFEENGYVPKPREEIEELLHRNERNVRLALEAADASYWEWDLHDDWYTSPELNKLFGRDISDPSIPYSEYNSLIHPDDIARIKASWITAIKSGEYDEEYRVIWSDKSMHWLSSKGRIYHDKNGKPRFFGLTRDITDRKRIEKVRTDSEQQLRLATQVAGMYTWELEIATSKVKFTGDVKGFTFTENDDVFSRIGRYTIPEDASLHQEALQRTIRGEGDLHVVNRVINPETGAMIYMESHATLVRADDGTPLRVVGIARNITETKRVEETLRESEKQLRVTNSELITANEDLKSFSYSVSHDLRAPLRAIKGFSNILLEDYCDRLDEEGKDILKRITRSTDKMASLIDDMLNHTRISQETMNCRKINLSLIANSVVNDIRQTEPQRNVQVTITDTPLVFADEPLMNIALTNLIGNAWKYTGKNPDAQIEIGYLVTEKEHIFFVRDNGAGFPMNLAYKLFQPFQRLHSDSQFTGTGIGLAIVQRIIQRHGGRIWAESETGCGAKFFFTLGTQHEAGHHGE